MLELSESLKIAVSSIVAIEVQNECVLIDTQKRLFIVSTASNSVVICGGLYQSHNVPVTVSADFYADLLIKLQSLSVENDCNNLQGKIDDLIDVVLIDAPHFKKSIDAMRLELSQCEEGSDEHRECYHLLFDAVLCAMYQQNDFGRFV